MQRDKISVSQLNKYIATLFLDDYFLKNVCVCGEVSNYKISNGNAYFNLKDSGGYISCIVFRSVLSNLSCKLEEGKNVIVYGKVNVYEPFGRYSIIISNVEDDGIGKIYEEYEKLKKELEEKGMFDPLYKKPIPEYAMNIGIVTSDTGAAIEDMKRIITNKNSHINIFLYPSLVQGNNAPPSIVAGIETLDSMNLDVIIVGRGGGSFEDLNCFNSVDIAYAVFNANTPIISAVGHEVDYTIIDFVADARAATPTEAADMASWSYEDLEITLDNMLSNIQELFYDKAENIKNKLEEYKNKIIFLSPKNKLLVLKNQLDASNKEFRQTMLQKIENRKNSLLHSCNLLEVLSPIKKLAQGYGYIENEKGNKIVSIKNVKIKDEITTYVQDGKIKSIVTRIERT